MRKLALLLFAAALASQAQQARKLIVISIDGLDHRYLKDRDAMKLRIPHLRNLIERGTLADGVVGIVPTVTWPSHTTLITGVGAEEHGILNNDIQTLAGSQRYWYASYLRAPTLWQSAKQAGRKVAVINWPVTVGAAVDYNLPEYFQARLGGATDRESLAHVATPAGLLDEIAAAYPSFNLKWQDDRARTQATVHILRRYQPDLTLLHLMDHDDAAHESGPFSPEAIASVELTDEYLGQILAAAPPNTVVAIVSDHGFEAAPRELNVAAWLASKKLSLNGTSSQAGYLTTREPAVAKALAAERSTNAQALESCIGREIPRAEIDRFLPATPPQARLFEPAPGCAFTNGKPDGALISNKPTDNGRHGHWPTRYRASFLISGPGIPAAKAPEMDMREAVHHFAKVLTLAWPPK